MEEMVNEQQDIESQEARSAGQEWNAPWVGGLILIVIGSVFLIQNFTGYWFQNWWALLIAIPGVLSLAAAVRRYRQNGERVDNSVLAAATGAVFPLLISAIFLFRLNWGEVWPLFLIAAGVIALLPRAFRNQPEN